MQNQTLIAVYGTRAEAERVRDRLIQSGIPQDDIRLSPDASANGEGSASRTESGTSFWDWLFGTDVPETDRAWYQSNLREERTAVSVRLSDVTKRALIEGILEEYTPISIGGEAMPSGSASASGEAEERIPIVKEELEVGKRQTEQRFRIRAYTVERPVEEDVTLRDERVVIERRPISSHGAADDQALKPRDVEIIERHEEPVVAKKAQATEEVVVRKDVKERTETVRDKVRETKVEVEKPTADGRPGDVPRQ